MKLRQSNKLIQQDLFRARCRAHDLPEPEFEVRFAPPRRWRFDYLFAGWLAVEKVGGVWIRGHHSRGKDQIADMEKRNNAILMGYLPLEFTPQQFDSGAAFAFIKTVLERKESRP